MFDYSVTVKQPLYTAGKVGTALRLASIEAEGAAGRYRPRPAGPRAGKWSRAYYGLLWAERYRTLVAETQEQRKLHAEMARTRFKNGVATEVDVLRSEVAVANGAPDLVRADNAIRQARALLNYYLGRPLDYPTEVHGRLPGQGLGPVGSGCADAGGRSAAARSLRGCASPSAAPPPSSNWPRRRTACGWTSRAYGISARMPANLLNSQFARWRVGVNFTLPVFDGFKRSGLV